MLFFFRGPLYANNFFSDVTVSKQFFPGKIFGMSPWHILVVKGMMCNILTVGHCHRKLEGWRKHSVTLENYFLFWSLELLSIFIIYRKIHPIQSHVHETVDN